MNSKKISVEYLLILEGKDNFCSNKSTFNNFILTNSDLNLIKDRIKYQELEVDYKVQFEQMKDDRRSIHIYFSCENTVDISQYEKFLRVVKTTFYKISKDIHTLKDDVSFHYAQLAYPKIHQIENLMRKLITKFMIINVGLSWTEKHIPKEVKDAPSNSKEKSNVNYLYNLDFIQLSNILFKEYSPLNTSELFAKIKKSDDISEINLSYLKKFVPTSNWERYFSKIVDSEADQLKKIWTKLYSFRNQVAHNNILSNEDFKEIDRLVTEIKNTLDKAIENIDQIKVSDEEKEIISSNIRLEDKNKNFFEFESQFNYMKNRFMKIYWEIDSALDTIILNNKGIGTSENSLEELSYLTLEDKIDYLETIIVSLPDKILNGLRNVVGMRVFLTQVEERGMFDKLDVLSVNDKIYEFGILENELKLNFVNEFI